MVPMKKLSMFAVSIVLAIGCGKKNDADKLVSDMEGWQKKMCECKDKACADKVHEDYKKWENDVAEPAMKKIGEPSKEVEAKFDKADDARKACRHKFDAPEAPPAGGDGATPPAPPAGEGSAAAGSAAPATP